MTGQVIQLRGGYVWKDGKITKRAIYRDASHAIASKKSKRVRVVKRKYP